MSTLLQDAFTGVSGTRLNAHTMDVGSGWTERAGNFQLTSTLPGTATQIDTTGQLCRCDANSGYGDVVISCQLAIPNTAGYVIGLSFRTSDNNNGWWFLIERDGAGTPYIVFDKWEAGVATRPFTAVNVGAITGSVVVATITLSGSSISATLDVGGTISGTDAFNATATRHGLFAYVDATDYPAGFWDNFLVTGVTPADAFTLSGPSSGPQGSASTNFAVTPNAPYTGTFTPTPASGCTFTPSSLSWSGDAAPKTFTVTKSTAGTVNINGTCSPALVPPSSISYTVYSATAFTITGPSSGPQMAPSSDFTVTPGAPYSGTFTPTPTAGVTFNPTSLTWAGDASAKTFTVTKSTPGIANINGTFSPALTAPAAVAYNAKATASRVYATSDGPINGVVGFQINNSDGTIWAKRNTASVVDHGSGVFSITALVPADGTGIVVWDDGSGLVA